MNKSKFKRGGNFKNRRTFGGKFKNNSDQKKYDFNKKTSFPKPERSSNDKKEFISLKETDVGITEYISSHEGFSGIIKARYSDFHVNEIDRDGKIAKLTTLEPPQDQLAEEGDEDLLKRYCVDHLPIEIWDQIHVLIQKPSPCKEQIKFDVTNKSKEERTKIHEAVKSVFGTKVVSSTVTQDEIKYVTFMKYDKNSKIDRREKWPKERNGEYVHFLVHKTFYDTLEATMRLAEALRVRASLFSYAGTKDRRAKTTQWFCIKRMEPSRIVEQCKRLKNIYVGNFCFKSEVLKLGYLTGNQFRIALRNVTADEDIVNNAVNALKKDGFLNYYGLQRFGNSVESPTHEIGKLLLKENWKEACDLILKVRQVENDHYVKQAKEIYNSSRDLDQALAVLGRNRDRSVEGKLLQGLKQHHENDYVNALEKIPRNMRLLYIHAYQSYVWNSILSRRVQEFGLKVLVGDLVLVGNEDDSILELPDLDKEDTEAEIEQEEIETKTQPKVNVKILTESDLEKYAIYDVVLPLPGFDIQYPDNIIKNWYKELLERDGLELEMSKIKVRTYCVSGAYRKCVGKVSNLSWQILKYNDPTLSLIRSDYEELKSMPEPQNIPDGKFKALVLDFCLPSSSYATMALREIMKQDTSRATQAQLNDYHQEKPPTTDNEKADLKREHDNNDAEKDACKKTKVDETNK